MDVEVKNILDQITDHYACKVHEEKKLQTASIIKFLEKYKLIIGVLSAMVISIGITTVIVTILIILKEIPLKILL